MRMKDYFILLRKNRVDFFFSYKSLIFMSKRKKVFFSQQKRVIIRITSRYYVVCLTISFHKPKPIGKGLCYWRRWWKMKEPRRCPLITCCPRANRCDVISLPRKYLIDNWDRSILVRSNYCLDCYIVKM